MNKFDAKDYLPLVQALVDGKTIQYKLGENSWSTGGEVDFTLPANQYRIKPEPKEIYMNRYESGDEIGAYFSLELAKSCANPGATQILYREVIE